MNAFVTGGAGFLGRRLVRRLLSAGHHVRCLVRPSSDVDGLLRAISDEQRDRLELRFGNLEDRKSLEGCLDGCSIVYHVAAEMRGGPPVLFLGNVVATRFLIDAAINAKVQRFVLVSSIAVYGTSQLRHASPVDESCALDASPEKRDPYTFSKVAQEQAAWAAHHERGLPLTVVRPGVIYGAQHPISLGRLGLPIGPLLLRVGRRRRLPFTHVENCAEAVMLAGMVPGIEGKAFNVVDEPAPTARQMLRAYRACGQRLYSITLPYWSMMALSWLYERYYVWSRAQFPLVLTPYRTAAIWKELRYSNQAAVATLGWQPLSPSESIGPR